MRGKAISEDQRVCTGVSERMYALNKSRGPLLPTSHKHKHKHKYKYKHNSCENLRRGTDFGSTLRAAFRLWGLRRAISAESSD
ncbi:uncharacterized protein GVI51_H08657 [Nakaseomyces glabratus]|uniref:Uncharacterized protein n=1 Tax=Candida glabrata (strain ATCC 2001 / BCRC 20586 / JCM 3761 / NBRC 0622 / NRRL Y-65 / CBS 138) TaxID=284593 RepID=Q6FRG5_CANGA|nr:uncharacterized protein CAGL0H08756g [Nakaseomyces glabratus]KAH7586373.1 hypothetical protein J7298_02453 [Nakaseomyces glabratus]KAH7600990.1 hypothetical protein J7295_02459 [Nakaseomyces glabratus]KAH7601610.1 hypothetical protein J7294_02447 [Nakaseomyces glabratus]KAH7605990.1 hypothetical protein J7293_02439 [Nakaseomyces glabratus]KAH7613429.1 hypothetical protein J7292_02436 [Nakaseomyces glabratus]|eukprot:XP_447179.1 uncharacterized protein CAGL0H08756g [[Candida] glabrata]